jgi:hypothetical protein
MMSEKSNGALVEHGDGHATTRSKPIRRIIGQQVWDECDVDGSDRMVDS